MDRKKSVAIFIAILVAGFSLLAYTGKNEPNNLVVISITGLQAKHMGLYGYERNTTPNIDAFSEEGFVFDNFFTVASRTVPASISLFTGQYPHKHGVWDWLGKVQLDSETETFTQLLKEHGYKTAGFSGGGQYNGRYGTSRGFDIFTDNKGEYVGFAENMDDAFTWLEENGDEKFFLFMQGFDTHCPYFPPEPYETMFDPDYKNRNDIDYSVCYWSSPETKPMKGEAEDILSLRKVITWGGTTVGNPEEEWEEVAFEERDIDHLISLYDGGVAYADFLVGKILDKLSGLGLEKNTIVVILADHGDVFRGEKSQFMGGGALFGTFYDDVLKVPLVIKIPDTEGGKRLGGLAHIIDVAPTILELLGIEEDKEMQGKSLLPLVYGDDEVNEYIYAGGQNYRPKTIRHPFRGVIEVDVIRNDREKLIRATLVDYDKDTTEVEYELYNTKEDPGELHNLYDAQPSIADDLVLRLEKWLVSAKKITPEDPAQQDVIQEKLLEEGRKRGYW